MTNSPEKLKYPRHEEIKRAGEYDGSSSNKVKMFVCEKHVTLWIKPNLNRGMMK